MMKYGGTVSALRASCDSTEGGKKYKGKGVVASLEILLHAIYYLSPPLLLLPSRETGTATETPNRTTVLQ